MLDEIYQDLLKSKKDVLRLEFMVLDRRFFSRYHNYYVTPNRSSFQKMEKSTSLPPEICRDPLLRTPTLWKLRFFFVDE